MDFKHKALQTNLIKYCYCFRSFSHDIIESKKIYGKKEEKSFLYK